MAGHIFGSSEFLFGLGFHVEGIVLRVLGVESLETWIVTFRVEGLQDYPIVTEQNKPRRQQTLQTRWVLLLSCL